MDPVEAGTWELVEDMLSEEIETKPYLTEQEKGDLNKP
jgi:hypothetical protein